MREKASLQVRLKNKLQKEATLWKRSFGKYKQLYLLLIPVILNFVIFHYVL